MYLMPMPTKRQAYGGVSSNIAEAGTRVGKSASKISTSLSKGEIIGIVIALVVLLVAVIGSIWWCCVRSAKKRDSIKAQEEEEEKKRIRENSVPISSSSNFEMNSNQSPHRHGSRYWQDNDYGQERRGSDPETFEDEEPLQKEEYYSPTGGHEEYGMALTSIPTQYHRQDFYQYHQQESHHRDHQQQRYSTPKYTSPIYTSSQ